MPFLFLNLLANCLFVGSVSGKIGEGEDIGRESFKNVIVELKCESLKNMCITIYKKRPKFSMT